MTLDEYQEVLGYLIQRLNERGLSDLTMDVKKERISYQHGANGEVSQHDEKMIRCNHVS